MKKIYYAFSLLLCAVWGQLFAQCPATGPTIYSILANTSSGGFQLQSINPTTGVGTTIGNLATTSAALAWDVPNGKLWYVSQFSGTGGIRIFSYDIASNTSGATTYQFFKNGSVINPTGTNKASYNPVDKKIYFHQGLGGLFRFDPANPAAGAVFIGNLSIDGVAENGSNTAGGDIAFDALGNMTGNFNNANKLVVFKAQYDANGTYQGINLSGQSFANSIAAPAAVAFLSDGNYIVGREGQSGILNTNTGVVTFYPVNLSGPGNTPVTGNSTADYASCATPAPNVSSVQKTGTRNCASRTITYTITVQNTGSMHAFGAVLKDATPAGLTLTAGTQNGISLTSAQLTSLNGGGLPLRSPGSAADSVLMKQTTSTVVLTYAYTAASDALPFSNQGFVSYVGIQTLNLPDDRIPTDDPATATAGDATILTGCNFISGSVRNDNTGMTNGVDGPSLAGATVTLYAADGVTVITTTTTDATGNYMFTGLGPGNYVVGVTPPAGFQNVSSTDAATPTDGRTSVAVPATGSGVAGIDFGLNRPPVATDNGVTGQATGTVATVPNILANDTDPNGGTLDPNNISLIAPVGATGVTTAPDGDITGFTVPGQGTWVLNPATGDVTFTPQAGFVGDPTPITYTVRDAAGLTSPPATITVDYMQLPPVATNDSSLGNPAGSTVAQNILANDTLSTGGLATPANSTVTLTNTGLPAGSTVSGNTVTVPGQGVWTYNPTGALSFAPAAGFTGNPTPLTYTLTENATGLSDNATVTVGYVQQPPVATNDSSLGNPAGSTLTQNILANDTVSNGQAAAPATTTVTLTNTGLPSGSTVSGNTVTVPGQGTWTYNPTTGALSFAPNAGFTGNPTPLTYTLTETATGLSDNATVTVGYVQQPPVATNDSSLGNPAGSTVTQNILANDTLSNGQLATPTTTTVTLTTTGLPSGSTVSGNTVTVPGQGTWTYNPSTGALSFAPAAGFTGNPTPLTYTLTENATGLSDNATVTVGYVQQPPVAKNDTDTYISGSAKTVNVIANDTTGSAPLGSTVVITTTGVSSDGKSLTVAGEGTWTVNPTTGAITFTPQTGFTGNPTPITYTVRDAQGDVSNPATVALTTGALPVTLISFTARAVDGKALLTWHTSKEVNFDRFVVQKFDPVTEQYTALREIPGGKSFYTTTDEAITREDNYYRLKMIDKDGTFEYSKVVSVEVPQPVRPLRVYPNPVTNRQFHISRETALESVRLADMTGREVPVRVTELPDAYLITISSAAPGAYLLVYQTKGVRFRKSLVIH